MENSPSHFCQSTRGIATYRARGADLYQSHFLAMLAEAYGKVGQTEDGLAAVAEALDWAQKTGGRYYEAELYRLKGTLTLQSQASLRQGNRVDIAHHAISTAEAGTVGGAHPTEEDEAEACFLKAIAVARQQQAKSLELRAVMSLSRLWQQQGKKAEARQLLADIHGWFTEGFDTKDLQEARALLEELAR